MAKKRLSTGNQIALVLANEHPTCYRPDCDTRLIVERDGEPVVNFEYAHIRDELPPVNWKDDIGWRYWPDDLTVQERNHFSNLILLCPPCHKLIDRIRPRNYSAQQLLEWKRIAEGSIDDPPRLSADSVNLEELADFLKHAATNSNILSLAIPRVQEDELSFASRSAEMVGREYEFASLNAFVELSDSVSWWTVIGPAGAGKSRLAYELCLSLDDTWDRGFASAVDRSGIHRWKPIQPTLIVIDYADGRAEWISTLLLHIATSADETWPPVRVLILERSKDATWFSVATRQEHYHESRSIMALQYAEPLEVVGLETDALVALVQQRFLRTLGRRASPEELGETLARIEELDRLRRPLFGLIATIERTDFEGEYNTRDQILDALIDRRLAQARHVREPISSRYLALLATILGGISFEELSSAVELVNNPQIDTGRLTQLETSLLEDLLTGMQPDIIGELWLLNEMDRDDLSTDLAAQALNAAWHYQPQRYAAFVTKCARDHAMHPALAELMAVDESRERRLWFRLAADLTDFEYRLDPAAASKIMALLVEKPTSRHKLEALSTIGFKLGNKLLALGELDEAAKTYVQMLQRDVLTDEMKSHIHTNLGAVYLYQDQISKALAEFDAVISSPTASDESRACCYNNRADIYDSRGEWELAIRDRTRVLELQYTSYNRRYIALARRASAYVELNRLDDAHRDIESILETNDIVEEQKMAARLLSANWHILAGDLGLARSDLIQILRNHRNFNETVQQAHELMLRIEGDGWESV
ncbi:tetratricopeptide repeat protein [Candidatus Poriferisodalis sp.]|uniref:tetratricopeptide repeat protein n=1 Tax=Candidatus Poriferisodalis sp. TaxID=3101277 RepID=UPI003B5A8FCD